MYNKAILQTQKVSGKLKVRFICWKDSKMYSMHNVGYTQCSRAIRSSYQEGQYFEANVKFNEGRGFYSAEKNQISPILPSEADEVIYNWEAHKSGAPKPVKIKKEEKKVKAIDFVDTSSDINISDENYTEVEKSIFSEPEREIVGVEWDENTQSWVNLYE